MQVGKNYKPFLETMVRSVGTFLPLSNHKTIVKNCQYSNADFLLFAARYFENQEFSRS